MRYLPFLFIGLTLFSQPANQSQAHHDKNPSWNHNGRPITPVPEPATTGLILAVSAFALLTVYKWRNKK